MKAYVAVFNNSYNSGSYHLQSIRWYNQYALVPGLGNLYGRLAFNQSFFAFAAALNFYPFFNYGYALANGFLILLLAIQGWHALIFRRGERSLAYFTTLCALPIAAYMVLRLNPASPSPTTASGVLQLLIWLHLARLFEPRGSVSEGADEAAAETIHERAHEDKTRAHIILILAATALTMHLSNIVFVATIALIVLIRNWTIEPYPLWIRLIILLRLTWLSMLILVVWMGRGYFLSGYPAYPSPVAGFAVDRAVPHFSVEAEATLIQLAARYGAVTEPASRWAWAGPWLRGLTTVDGIAGVLYPVLLALLLWAAYGGLRKALRSGWIHQAQSQERKSPR